MLKEEMFAGYLEALNQINESTHLALETLNKNAETTRMIMDELLNGAAEAPSHFRDLGVFTEDIVDVTPYIEDNETIESLTDKIVAEIKAGDSDEPGIRSLSITIDPDKFNTAEVMKLIQKKLASEETKEEKPKETYNDDFNFDINDFDK